MKCFDEDAHSFIVRLWLEPRELKGAAPKWRGVIEHVATGERRHLKDFIDIERFILKYLQKMGVNAGRFGPIHRWLKRLMFPFTGGH